MEDEWKRKAEMEKWNDPERVALAEYASIMGSHNTTVIGPLIRGGKLDRDAIPITKLDLEFKLNDPGFAKLPFKTKFVKKER